MASFRFFLSRRQTDSTTWMFGSCLFMFKRPPQLFRENVFSDESRAAQAENLLGTCLLERELPPCSVLSQPGFVRRKTEQLRWSVAFVACVLFLIVAGTPCFGEEDSTLGRANGKGRVTIVYQDDAIQPENRDI